VHARYAQPLIDLKMPKDVAEALSVDPAYKAQAVQLKSICDKIQIPFVDTTDLLTAQENQGKPQFWAYDSHPRPEGYATIADAIAQALKR
jgi:lysophospholipase L1-like esterase